MNVRIYSLRGGHTHMISSQIKQFFKKLDWYTPGTKTEPTPHRED